MKRTLAFIAFGVFGAGCLAAGTDSPIRIGSAHRLKPSTGSGTCDVDTALDTLAGVRDIATGTDYFTEFDVDNTSETNGITTSVNGNVIAGADRNDYIGTEAVFTYKSFPPLSFSAENVPLYMLVKAGTTGNKVLFNLIGPKAANTLMQGVQVGTQDFRLDVTWHFNGHLASGQNLASNTVTFPITIVNSGFGGVIACTADADCPNGMTCSSGTCARACTIANCTGNQTCTGGICQCPTGTAPATNGPCGSTGGQDTEAFCCGGTVACPQ